HGDLQRVDDADRAGREAETRTRLVGAGRRVDDDRPVGVEPGDHAARAHERRMEDGDQLRPLDRIAAPNLTVRCAEANVGANRRAFLLGAVRREVGAVQAAAEHAGLGEDLAGEVRAEPADRLEADAEEAVLACAGEIGASGHGAPTSRSGSGGTRPSPSPTAAGPPVRAPTAGPRAPPPVREPARPSR